VFFISDRVLLTRRNDWARCKKLVKRFGRTGEMGRLTGTSSSSVQADRFSAASSSAKKWDTTAIINAKGGKVLGGVRHPINSPDFASYLLQAQASRAKVIGLANAGGDTINSIKAANEFGLTKTQTLAGLLVFVSDIHSLGLQATQGMYVTEAWYWDLNDQTRKWSKRFFDKTQKMPTMIHAGVYSATTMYLNAVKATGTDDADAVMAWMRANKHSDMFGTNMSLREDGRLVHDMYLFQVKKPSESKGEWDYYNMRQVIPADSAFQPLSLSRCPLVKKP
jgi:branched-chain amino acid transport system substrate-binding protein